MAAFRGMHVSPAKHSYAWLPRKCDYRTDTHTDGQTDAGQSDPYVSLCFAGDTKTTQTQFNFLPSEITSSWFTNSRTQAHNLPIASLMLHQFAHSLHLQVPAIQFVSWSKKFDYNIIVWDFIIKNKESLLIPHLFISSTTLMT